MMLNEIPSEQETALALLVDDDIEKSFLGCLLGEPKCFDSVAWFLPAFFGIAVHGKIFEAIKLHRQQGRDFCPEMIGQYFSNDNDLAMIGGAGYLKDLARSVISFRNVKGYANHLLTLHYRRMALCVGKSMEALAINAAIETPPETLLGNIERIIAEAQNLKIKDNIKTASEGVDAALAMAKNPMAGVHSGFNRLHRITGGFKPSQLITIGARPGMGKTAMALTLAVNAAKAGKRGLIFSLEMSHEQLWQRIIARASQCPIHSGDIHDDEWPEIEQAAARLKALPLDIDDSSALTALEICARAAQYKRRNGLDIIFVDYLGFIKAADPKANRVHQIEEITGSLKGLAKTLQIPVVLLCQLSRAIESKDDKRPVLSDLRDSGCIEQDSDIVMFIYREEYYRKKTDKLMSASTEAYNLADAEAAKGKVELIVAKNRQNVLETIDLKFSGERQEFYE